MFARLYLLLVFAIAFTLHGLHAHTAKDGPLPLSDAQSRELFAALDLSLPGMESVRQYVAEKKWQQARSSLADYYRNRQQKTWHFAPPAPDAPADDSVSYNATEADSAVSGRVTGGYVRLWHTFPENNVNWKFNPTGKPGDARFDPEWQWQLNRMMFWRQMANAYRATKDEKYTEAWLRQFRSFVANNPRPKEIDRRPGSTWRTIECGIRSRSSWPTAFHAFLRSPIVTDEDICQYLYASLQHAEFLRDNPTAAGNWLTMEMSGLYTIGAVFPEFADAQAWRKFAIDTSARAASQQFVPDGAQYELSPSYHRVALDNILTIPDFAAVVGLEHELPDNYTTTMENGFAYMLGIMNPSGHTPSFNDSGAVNVRGLLRRALPYFPERKDFLWAVSGSKEGIAPDYTSIEFPWAGYIVMRSGWEPDASVLYFDTGPLGYAHVHQDKLNLVFYAYGREILFDNGGGTYERSPWRQYFISTFSHNTVLVDGKPQVRQVRDRMANVSKAPIDSSFRTTAAADSATGIYADGYGKEDNFPATHRRRVLFHKPDVVIVADTLTPNDSNSHDYQARWHLDTTNTRYELATETYVTTDRGKPNMSVTALQTKGLSSVSASAQEEPEKLGWNASTARQPTNYPATTVLHNQSGRGIQNFVTMLVAMPADSAAGDEGGASLVKETRRMSDDSYAVLLEDGRVLQIRVPVDTNLPIEVREIPSD